MDESENQSTGWFVLAGYIASAEQWAAFTAEWEDACSHLPANKKGQQVFKFARDGRAPERLAPFRAIINRHVEMSVACIVNSRDIEAALRRIHIPDVPGMDWSDFGNKYYVAIRYFMDMFHKLQAEASNLVTIREPVDFVFDMNSSAGRIKRAWNIYIDQREPKLREWFGELPGFIADEDCMPLQAADLNAGQLRAAVSNFGLEAVKTGAWPRPLAPDGAREIQHLILSISQDDMARDFVTFANEMLPDALEAFDSRPPPIDRIDAPFPAERFARWLGSLFGRPKVGPRP